MAEKLLCGEDKITNGCGSDLQNATNYAYHAVRKSGMFGDLVSYSSTDFQNSSEEYNAKIDFAVKKILDVSLYCQLISLTIVDQSILNFFFTGLCRNRLKGSATC